MLALFRLQVLQGLRNRSYLWVTIGMPVGLYLLQITLVDADWVAEGLPAPIQFMVSMATFGVLSLALGLGPQLARDQHTGWLRQLRATPLPPAAVITARIATALTLALPVVAIVFVAGAVSQGVGLSPFRWVGMLVVLVAGAIPLAVLGVLVGTTLDPDTAEPANMVLMLGLLLLGGLFIPVMAFPAPMQAVAHALPSYRLADLAWTAAAEGGLAVDSAAQLAAWTVGLGALALGAFRRLTARP